MDARGQLELGVNPRATLSPGPHRWFEFNWQVLPASHPTASQPSQISQPTQDFLRRVSRGGALLLPQSPCLFPVRSSRSCRYATCEELVQAHVLPRWESEVSLGFFFPCLLHLGDLSARSLVCCLVLYIGTYSFCESNSGN